MDLLAPDAVRSRLDAIPAGVLSGIRRGVEREALRFDEDGKLAVSPHPAGLGPSLTHPLVTTDYAEAMLELVTPPFADAGSLLAFLADLHAHVRSALGDELMWPASMPCVVPDEAAIEVASFGPSNPGRFKHLYRVGLGHRYGRMMETIAGIHVNVSLPDEVWRHVLPPPVSADRAEAATAGYFGLLRNFLRLGWLVPYLCGASPALCRSFLKPGQDEGLKLLDDATACLPHATSLRLSRLGYHNRPHPLLDMAYGSLDEYTTALRRATATPLPEFTLLGVGRGELRRQISDCVLQIENEFYAPVRPKQPPLAGERPLAALERRGVAYVEIRTVDLDPFEPCGLGRGTLLLVESLVVLCGLLPSPPLDGNERRRLAETLERVVTEGRRPGLALADGDQEVPLRVLAGRILDALAVVAVRLDRECGAPGYLDAVVAFRRLVEAPEATPSGRLLSALIERGETFFTQTMRLAVRHDEVHRRRIVGAERQAEFARITDEAWKRRRCLEEAPSLPFDEYVEAWLAS